MVGFKVFASLLLLLPLASLSDDDLAPGRTLLIETVDDEPESEAKHHNDGNDKQEIKLPVNEHISRSGNGNDYSHKWTDDVCAGPGLHGAPCTLGSRWRFPGRCCGGTCKRLKTWQRQGCPIMSSADTRWKPTSSDS